MTPAAAPDAVLSAKLAEMARQLEEERAARSRSEQALMELLDDQQLALAELLHDTASQSINAARIYARVARDTVRRSCPDAVELLTTLDEATQTAADELQALSRWLRPWQLDGDDLLRNLKALCELATRSASCEFRSSLATIQPCSKPQAALLRITQLVLFSLVRDRHASALEIRLEERVLVLEIRVAAARPLPEQVELLLDGRARAVGGSFSQRGSDSGAVLSCRVPG